MGYRQQASGKTARDRPCKTLLTASESHTSTAARGRAICASLGAPSPHLLNRAQASRRGPIRLDARPSLLASRAGGVGPSEACRQAARMSKAANPSAHRHRRELLLSPVAHASTVREPRHPAARREQSDPREAARGVPSAEPGARARAGADASWLATGQGRPIIILWLRAAPRTAGGPRGRLGHTLAAACTSRCWRRPRTSAAAWARGPMRGKPRIHAVIARRRRARRGQICACACATKRGYSGAACGDEADRGRREQDATGCVDALALAKAITQVQLDYPVPCGCT